MDQVGRESISSLDASRPSLVVLSADENLDARLRQRLCADPAFAVGEHRDLVAGLPVAPAKDFGRSRGTAAAESIDNGKDFHGRVDSATEFRSKTNDAAM
ncbi:MAG: hypothetical protein AAF750_18820 [Planctomycetota bacterium]